MHTSESNQHQLDNGSILFRTDRNTEERFYDIVLFMNEDKMAEFETTKVKNKDHEESLKRCKNLKDVFEINKKFEIKNPSYTFHTVIVKETHVS